MYERSFKLGISKQFLFLIGLASCVSLYALNKLALQMPYKLLLFIATITYFYYIVRREVLFLSPKSIMHLVTQKEGDWLLHRGGEWQLAQLRGNSVITPYFVILNFTLADGKASCTIFRDALSEEAYRQLVVTCRVSK